MESYNRWFENFIQGRLMGIIDPMERIGFLFREKDNFISLNRGIDATQIVHRFDTLIAREKIYAELILATDKHEKTDNSKTKKEEFIDYSGNSAAEKIVFLNELGILDLLNKKAPFNTSTNKLAEVISAFTGINQSTAQSYLNPIFSKDVDKSKSPISEKNLKSVSEKLIKMGYIK